MSQKIKVAVFGAAGKMGSESVKAILSSSCAELCGAVDTENTGMDAGIAAGYGECGIIISGDAAKALENAQCVLDFTNANAAPANIKAALSQKIPCVVGTTGIDKKDLMEIEQLALTNNTAVLIVPNFSIGAVLMMKFAKEAANYFNTAEIIELHHDKKLDAPSGTALMTAEKMAQSNPKLKACKVSKEKLEHVRGGNSGGIHIHSVRLPGFVAHQEVLFGGEGEVLTIKHDSMSRVSFMPGVLKAICAAGNLKGLLWGLEHVL